MPPNDDDVLSESDLEIVHPDGTVTDKRDGVRRPYAEHVARFRQTVMAAGADHLITAPLVEYADPAADQPARRWWSIRRRRRSRS